MSIKPRIKVSSIQACLNYLRNMVLTGATSVHFTSDDIDTEAYEAVLRNAIKYAKQCAEMILMASERGGLDKVFEATYGKTMKDYLTECLGKVKPPKKTGDEEPSRWGSIYYFEDVVSCYLGFLTAVEAITAEAPYPLSQRATEQ
jgi:hypothetical protein